MSDQGSCISGADLGILNGGFCIYIYICVTPSSKKVNDTVFSKYGVNNICSSFNVEFGTHQSKPDQKTGL